MQKLKDSSFKRASKNSDQDETANGHAQFDYTEHLKQFVKIHTLVIDCSMMGYIDSVGVKLLKQVVEEFHEVSVKVLFSGCRGPVRQTFVKADFFETCSFEDLYLSNHDAVLDTTRRRIKEAKV